MSKKKEKLLQEKTFMSEVRPAEDNKSDETFLSTVWGDSTEDRTDWDDTFMSSRSSDGW